MEIRNHMKSNIFKKLYKKIFGQATKQFMFKVTYKNDQVGYLSLKVPQDAMDPKVGDIIESYTSRGSIAFKITGTVFEHMDYGSGIVYYWIEEYLGTEISFWEFKNKKIEKNNNE
jgi:hypothetical protein